MIRVGLLFLLVGASWCYNDLNSHWKLYKQVHGKNYETPELEAKRRQAFEHNVGLVVNHNIAADLGIKSYRLKINQYADLTNEEFGKLYNGLRFDAKNRQSKASKVHKAQDFVGDLPKTVDWRSKGLVLPIKNQAQCGSCWAFAAVAAIEGQHAKATGKLVSLSEQDLVDCSGAEGNMGCEGGLPDQGYDYVIKNGGIDSESSYPYEAQDDSCRYKGPPAATIKSYTDIEQGSEKALQTASASVGPISVGIDASNFSFQLYGGGVYDEEDCSTSLLDHGVTVVGYGSENGSDFWLVKNSWGDSWGEEGYIKMSRNKNNQCGISTMASYPNV